MLLNCKKCYKNVNEWCFHFNVSQLSLLTFKMVLMTLMLALMKVYFSLLYAEWRIWILKSVTECWLKCKNRNWIWFMRKCSYFRANECIYCSPFLGNDYVFSRNEQQKVQFQTINCQSFLLSSYLLLCLLSLLESLLGGCGGEIRTRRWRTRVII